MINIPFRSATGSSTTGAVVPSLEKSATRVVLEAVTMTCNERPSSSFQYSTFYLVQRIWFLHIAWSYWTLRQGRQGRGMIRGNCNIGACYSIETRVARA